MGVLLPSNSTFVGIIIVCLLLLTLACSSEPQDEVNTVSVNATNPPDQIVVTATVLPEDPSRDGPETPRLMSSPESASPLPTPVRTSLPAPAPPLDPTRTASLSPTRAPTPIPEPPATPVPEPAPTPTPRPAGMSITRVRIEADTIQQLEATLEDANGNPMGPAEVTWEVLDPKAGSFGPDGLFTASVFAGTYEKAIVARSAEFGLSATDSTTITPCPLHQVGIAPDPADIGIGMTQQFVAAGADQFGNRIAGLDFKWSVESIGGTIDSSGLFTAGSDPGTYENSVNVMVTSGETVRSGTVSVTVEPDRIAFLSRRDAEELDDLPDIYLMNVDGTDVRKVGRGGVSSDPPSWSPDGRPLTYSGAGSVLVRSVGFETGRVIYDGTLPVRNPSWSPDGARIVFQSYEHAKDRNDLSGSEIYLMDIDGGNRVRLTTNVHWDGAPSWSPDGSKIGFSRDVKSYGFGHIFVMNVDSSNETRLSGGGHNLSPKWSPDGTKIILRHRASPRGRSGIGVPNSSALLRTPQWIEGQPSGDLGPDWSPINEMVVFYSYRDSGFIDGATSGERLRGFEIYTVDPSGGRVARITENDWYDGYGVWAPRKRVVEVSESSVVFRRSDSPPLEPVDSIVTEVGAGVARIKTDRGSGSGFIIDPDGLILTNNHVIRDTENITVIPRDGREFEGTVRGRDLVRDLAVVTIEASDLPRLVLGDIGHLRLGKEVLVVGYPLNSEELNITRGLVSAIKHDPGRNLRLIQTDFAVNPGNRGGPMVNRQGEVVAIVTSKIASVRVEGIGFAVSVNTIKTYLDRLKGGEVITD